MSLILICSTIALISVKVSSQTSISYGSPIIGWPLLNEGLGQYSTINNLGMRSLTDQTSLESSLSRAASSGRGRIVGNSILEFEPQPPIQTITGTRSGVRYRSQAQAVRPTSQARNRPLTTGPSVGMVRNGIDETEEFDINDERPTSPTSTSSSKRGSSSDNMEVSKFVSVFVAPPEPIQAKRSRVIKSSQKVHYNIMFIKAPSTLPESQEIELPPSPQTKTLVYVLLRKPESKDLLRITQSPQQAPQKPEVFFIRYKNEGMKRDGKSVERGKGTPTPTQIELDDGDNDNSDINNQTEEDGDNLNSEDVKTTEPKRRGEAEVIAQSPERSLKSGNSRRLISNLGGGYVNEHSQNIDNDFSSRESFDEDKLLLSSRLQQYNQNQHQQQQQHQHQRVVHSDFSFVPIMKPSYGIGS